MDVYVKSFNRPYYLERCLHSIFLHLSGDFIVTILDDGTPRHYLDLIRRKFPMVAVQYSDQHLDKSKAVSDHVAGKTTFNHRGIPTEFWKAAVSNGSPIFLLMEEDSWFKRSINLDECRKIMIDHGCVSLKLYWSGNPAIAGQTEKQLGPDIWQITPPHEALTNRARALLLKRPLLRKLSIRSRIVSPRDFHPYYTLYTVSAALFSKSYWLSVWDNAAQGVNEYLQLGRALDYYLGNPGTIYARTLIELTDTSYITTSVNPFQRPQLDFITFNHYLKEAWFEGNLDPLRNFPADFPVHYLASFLPNQLADQWRKWIYAFRKQFTDQGCVINC